MIYHALHTDFEHITPIFTAYGFLPGTGTIRNVDLSPWHISRKSFCPAPGGSCSARGQLLLAAAVAGWAGCSPRPYAEVSKHLKLKQIGSVQTRAEVSTTCATLPVSANMREQISDIRHESTVTRIKI